MKVRIPAKEPERSRLRRSEAHILPLARLVERLRTDVDLGLSQKEAYERRRLYGLNRIPRIKPSRLRVYTTPFRNWLISTYLLISGALAFLAFFFMPEIWKQVAYWLSIISVNAIIAAVQQEKAQTKLESLEDLLAPRSKVLRDGRLIEVSSDELVPGDIIRLAPGDRVPADGRIIEAWNFKVDEASLTGESMDVEKSQGEMGSEDCRTLSDIRNTVFLGTYVTTGYARVVVTYTGRRTEIGRISATLREVGGGEILLRDKINRLAKYLALAVAAYLVISLAYHIVVLHLRNQLFVGDGLNVPLVAAVVGRNLITGMSIMPINIPLLTTIVLVTGVLAMAQHHVIIRDLNAVETLGRVSIVCADKTGTITRDEMTSKWIYLPSARGEPQLYAITGSGLQSDGRILAVDPRLGLENILRREPEALTLGEVAVKEGTGLELLLVSGLLNNEASIIEERVKVGGHEQAVHRVIGEATDASLLVMCRKSRVDEGAYRLSYQEFCSYPLESRLKLATKVFRHGEKFVVFTKGATESVLSIADSVWEDGTGGIHVLSDYLRAEFKEKAEVFSSCGFRVISFAFKQLDELPSNISDRASVERNLCSLGFVAIIDAPREGVLKSVVDARDAGIKTVMITGDSVETGRSIAEEVGIYGSDDLVVEGYNLDRLSNEEFLKASVFARTSPGNKLAIIDRYKSQNHVVAMTGDGINDALAITKADVGIAMGVTGTDIAKEAADMVISDDSYSSIITGIREGRGLFKKIRSIVFFYVAVNMAEASIFFGSSFIPGFHLLTPSQHLFITLTTHSIPPFALVIDSLSKDVMRERPRDTEDIFTKRLLAALLLFTLSLSLMLFLGYFGVVSGAVPVFDGNKIGFTPVFGVANTWNPSGWAQAKARTLLYVILIVSQCTLVVSLRRMNKPIWSILKEDIDWFIWPFILAVPAALLAMMYTPSLQIILAASTGLGPDIVRLTAIDWTFAVLLGAVPIALLEYYKTRSIKRGLPL